MAKYFAFPVQDASNECPAVPRAVKVMGKNLHQATMKLANALANDSQLVKEHPEFNSI